MKKIILLILCISTSVLTYSQVPLFEWAKQMGGTSSDIGKSIVSDNLGNVYTTGYFAGTADFDPGVSVFNLTSAGSDDVFISKIDASGALVWVKQIGGFSGDVGRSIALDKSGNTYITGSFNNTVDFDPGMGTFNLTATGSTDVFIIKLDPSGNFIWAKNMEGTSGGMGSSNGYGTSIYVDLFGNVFTTGYFLGTIDFNPGIGTFNLTNTAGAGASTYISKLNASGDFVWAKNISGTAPNYGASIAVDSSDNVITIGRFGGVADLNPGAGTFSLTSAGGDDVYILKLNASGNFVWAKQIGSSLNDQGSSIALDYANNIYATGNFNNTVDFDPGAGTYTLSSTGSSDVFVSKLDSNGVFVWAKQMGSPSDDYGSGISLDLLGNIYTTGSFNGVADFDPAATTYTLSSGFYDVFVSKLNPSGNFMWAIKMGGSGGESGNSIAIDASNNVYTTGYFVGTVDFDPGIGISNLAASGSNSEIFVHKMSQNATVGLNEISTSNISFYPNPSSGILNIELFDSKETELIIYNTTGQKVLSKTINDKTVSIDLSGLANGVYYLQAKNKNGTETKKIIINK